VFYLLGGLAATAAQVAADPSSTVPNLGASGAIAAVMGAFLVTYPRDRIRSLLVIFIFVQVRYIPAALLIGVWFLMQLLNLGAVDRFHHLLGGLGHDVSEATSLFGDQCHHRVCHELRIHSILLVTQDLVEETLHGGPLHVVPAVIHPARSGFGFRFIETSEVA